jgi:hypothetical protein
LFHKTGYQFRKTCSKIGYCFMKLGISSEKLAAKLGIVSWNWVSVQKNLQQNWVLFCESGYQFKRFAALYSDYSWFNLPIRQEKTHVRQIQNWVWNACEYQKPVLVPFFFNHVYIFCSPTFDLVPSLSETGTL